MQIEKQYRWVNKEDFQKSNPMTGKIVNVLEEGKDLIVVIDFDAIGLRKVSLWGDNQNLLIDKLGKTTEEWASKRISYAKTLTVDGKVRNCFTAI